MKYFITCAVFFVVTLAGFFSFGQQRLTEAEVNRITNRYIWTTPQWETIAEIRAIKDRVRRTGSPHGHQPGYNTPRTNVVVVQPPAEPVAETPVTVTVTTTAIPSNSSSSASGVVVTASAGADESISASASVSVSEQVGLPPNPTSSNVEPVSSAAFRSLLRDLDEAMTEQTDRIRDALSDDDLSPEVLIAKLKEKGATKEQQNELILAFENEEFSVVSRLWITAGGDPIEAGRISRTLNLVARLESVEQAIEDDEFSSDDLRHFRRLFDKSKQDRKTEGIVKRCLANLGLFLDLRQRIDEASKRKEAASVAVPEGEAKVVFHSKWPAGAILALDEDTFIVGTKMTGAGKEKKRKSEEEGDTEKNLLEIVETSLDEYLPRPPVSETAPIASGAAGNRFTLHNTGSEAIVFTLGREKKTLAPGETGSYVATESGSIAVAVTKTRTVSTGGGRRRGGTTQQSYQETQSLAAAAGIAYEGRSVSGVVTLTPLKTEITLDNTENTQPFHLEVDGVVVTVSAGESQMVGEATGAVSIRFARSDDPGDIVSYELTETKTCKPAISTADGKWSLFDQDAATR